MNDDDEADVIAKALEGLAAASRETNRRGLPIVYVEGDKLLRKENGIVTVLETLPPLPRVSRSV